MEKIFKPNGKFEKLKKEILANKEFVGLEIPDYMVFELATYLDDREKCEKCKGLNYCPQRTKGYQPIMSLKDKQISYKQCKYRQELDLKYKKESLFKTKYFPKKTTDASLDDFYISKEAKAIKQFSNGVIQKTDKKMVNTSRANALKMAVNFVTNYKNGKNPKGMYLYGNFGSGKTYLLAAIGNELAKNNIESMLIYFPDLVMDLKSNMDLIVSKLNVLKEVPVLMIDDIGSENLTPWVRDEILSSILQYRVLDMKPTFFSSNLDGERLSDHLDNNDKLKAGRILKRIVDLCDFVQLEE